MDGLSAVRLDVASVGPAQLTSTQSRGTRSHPAMDAAAKALGISTSDLGAALRSGQSLASIASSKGVSQDALVGAMAAAIQEANPGISADQASKVATAIATRTPPSGGTPPAGSQSAAASGASSDPTQATGGATAASGRHHHGHHALAAGMDAAAKTLGMTTSDLVSSLQSGQSIASIASAKGVSQDDVVKAISSALSQADSNLSADQATQIATAVVTGAPRTSQGQPWASAASGTSSTYNILA